MISRRPGRAILLLVLCCAGLAMTGCRTWTAREERAAAAYNLGNYHREAGRDDEAIEAYRAALAEAPEFRAASFNLALALADIDQAEEALEILESLRLKDPRNLMILNAMAWAAWKNDDPDMTIGYFDDVLAIFPAEPEALHGKADVLDDIGRYADAASVRRVILDLEPETSNRLDLALSLLESGDPSSALDEYRIILAGEPNNTDALVGAVLACETLGLVREELEYRERAVEVSGDDAADHHFRIARLLLVDFGDYEKGLNALGSALQAGYEDDYEMDQLIADSPATIRPAIRNLVNESREVAQ